MGDGVTGLVNAHANQAGQDAASSSAHSATQTEFAKTLSQEAQKSGDAGQTPVSINGVHNPDTGPYKTVRGTTFIKLLQALNVTPHLNLRTLYR